MSYMNDNQLHKLSLPREELSSPTNNTSQPYVEEGGKDPTLSYFSVDLIARTGVTVAEVAPEWPLSCCTRLEDNDDEVHQTGNRSIRMYFDGDKFLNVTAN